MKTYNSYWSFVGGWFAGFWRVSIIGSTRNLEKSSLKVKRSYWKVRDISKKKENKPTEKIYWLYLMFYKSVIVPIRSKSPLFL